MTQEASSLLSRAFRTALGQVGGRLLLTGTRFFITILIARNCGTSVFGDYLFILSLLMFCELVMDFGMTDVVVSDICQNPKKSAKRYWGLIGSRILLAFVCLLLMGSVLSFMGYSEQVRIAGYIGAIELLFFIPILLFKAIFKREMKMDRDVFSELLSTLLTLPLIAYFAFNGAEASTLVGLYVLSRFLFLLIGFYFARKSMPEAGGISIINESQYTLKKTFPLGISIVLIGIFEVLDPIFLSKMASSEAIAYFSGSIRFVVLLSLVVIPVSDTAFPILASTWKRDMERFRQTLFLTFRIIVVISGCGFCGFYVSSGFLLSIMGEGMMEANNVFKALTFFGFWKGIIHFLAALVIISGGIIHATWLTIGFLILKLILLFWLVPAYGALGAAYVNGITSLSSTVITSIVVAKLIGFQVNWGSILKVLPICAATILIVQFLGFEDQFIGGILAGIIYFALIFMTGTIHLNELKSFKNAVKRN